MKLILIKLKLYINSDINVRMILIQMEFVSAIESLIEWWKPYQEVYNDM
jgi:hypothetical protein